jgi:nucleoid-associated protein YgaU
MSIFRKKPKADFSAVQGGSASTSPAQPAAAPPAQPAATEPGAAPAGAASPAPAAGAAAAQRTYTVAKGDTLSAIAQREYGAASKWRAIYEANRDQISNPDRIKPGQVLVIPPVR